VAAEAKPPMDNLSRLYRVRFSEADRRRKDQVWRVLCQRFFQRYVSPSDTVLDIGCGYGEFSRHIRAARKVAVDVNADAAAHLPPGTEFHCSDATDLGAIAPSSVDVCFSSNFFEHLPSKNALDLVLEQCLRVLKPRGRYLAMQPNIRYAPGEYWDYYDHILPLSDRSCAEAFIKAGYEITEVIDRFVPFSTSSRLPQSPWIVSLYLSCRPAWRIFGRQCFIVARKPEAARKSLAGQG
jgi:SAM-dependent methyltransferase